VISIIIIFGLIPSSIILVINLSSKTMSLWTYVAQFSLFVISCITFFFVGAIGQMMLDE
jgi:hypothetical protein